MSAVEVRPFRDDDAEALVAMNRRCAAAYAELAPDLFRVPDEDGFRDFVLGDAPWRALESNVALVAEVDGHVAGYLEASILEASESARWQWSTDARTTRLFIGALACDPAHRRQGVATALVKAAEVWGRARGAVVAVTETWARSPWSMPFWETGMGYRPKNVMLRKPLEPLS